MKFRLRSLALQFRKQEVTLPFHHVTYFWGQMGAGKSSIAKMIDYCLGGNVELSPAMQSEFVGARLEVALKNAVLSIERERDADNVLASWGTGEDAFQVIVPSRRAGGEVLPGTEVENLSDLVFYLSGLKPPRVRKSKKKADSDIERLSLRDLLWYCYLDQDEIDSSFFHLERGADTFKQLKSRDVLRYVIGFHDERVAEIEAELDRVRGERLGIAGTMESLRNALKQVGIETEAEIGRRREELVSRAEVLSRHIAQMRASQGQQSTTVHAADQLRSTAISLSKQLAENEQAQSEVRQKAEQDKRHLHELETLAVKFKRSLSARAVLGGVKFEACPRCTQLLPDREMHFCHVCGQVDETEIVAGSEEAVIDKDLKARTSELRDVISRHDAALEMLTRERSAISARKNTVERERNEAMAEYDSAFLSNMIALERERAAVLQEIEGLASLERFPRLLDQQAQLLGQAYEREALLRASWKEAKAAAEEDDTNLELLKGYFLEYLLRAKVPGISATDEVEIPKTDFFPIIRGNDARDQTETSFTTLSSGGKKTLFKCCFAIAIHRLAVQLEAPLLEMLIIDSPMKNISERENREQFDSFYNMVYELSVGELSQTQIILIDKEFAPPPAGSAIDLISRHMKPSDPDNPPLIPYYRGN
ncbi:AAA family ATPase [Rhizobium gallicum]|uniref:AAA family ATPase n=1 Tax=Rhizobium gallicum TaxID=56730 RepID=UPI0030B8DB8B